MFSERCCIYCEFFFSLVLFFASVGFSSACFLSQVDCLIGIIMVGVVVVVVAQIHDMMIIFLLCYASFATIFFSLSLSLSLSFVQRTSFFSVSNCSTVCIIHMDNARNSCNAIIEVSI